MSKLYDCVVKTGTYVQNGEEKARWQNVGAVISGKDGSKLLLLEKWFNPAGIKDDGGNGENVLIRLMDVNRNNSEDSNQSGGYTPSRRNGASNAPF